MLPSQLPATLFPLSLLSYNLYTTRLLWLPFPMGIHRHTHKYNRGIHTKTQNTLKHTSSVLFRDSCASWVLIWKEKLLLLQIMTGTQETSGAQLSNRKRTSMQKLAGKHAKSTKIPHSLKASLIRDTHRQPPTHTKHTHTHTSVFTHPPIMLYNQKASSHFSSFLRASQVRGLSVH